MTPKALVLYHMPYCPYCVDVRRQMSRLGISAELRDVSRNSQFADELRVATGRHTVPVLKIEHVDGQVQWLPESLDIIDYLGAGRTTAPALLRARVMALRWAPWVCFLLSAFVGSPFRWVLVACGGLLFFARYVAPRAAASRAAG